MCDFHSYEDPQYDGGCYSCAVEDNVRLRAKLTKAEQAISELTVALKDIKRDTAEKCAELAENLVRIGHSLDQFTKDSVAEAIRKHFKLGGE